MNLNELRKIPLLRALSDEQLAILQGNAKERDYKKNESIFEPDSKDNFIMIVLEGKVRIYLAYPDGKEFTISDCYKYHLVPKKLRRSLNEAREATKILAINAKAFHLFMLNNPTILIRTRDSQGCGCLYFSAQVCPNTNAHGRSMSRA